MDTTMLGLTVIPIVTSKMCLLLGLWLRLRWRTRHEQVQRQHLASVTSSVPDDSQVEVVEQRPDGFRVSIKITRSRAEKSRV
ncbi:hypothetical protein [Streptomyces longisporoflavus]|uniref:Secreted protein n=1 Tax=Streptomyces longisporoflavus TaxID=28044 RepID=A0ABW7R3F4_9ACTN